MLKNSNDGLPKFSFRPREEGKEDLYYRILESEDNETLIKLSPEKKSELLKYCFDRTQNTNFFESVDELSILTILSVDKHFKKGFEEFIKLSPVLLLGHAQEDIEALIRFLTIFEARDISLIKKYGALSVGLNKIFVEENINLETTTHRFNRFLTQENKWRFKNLYDAEKQFLIKPIEISQRFASACASEAIKMIGNIYIEKHYEFSNLFLEFCAFTAKNADVSKRSHVANFALKTPSEILIEYGNTERRDLGIIKKQANITSNALLYGLISLDDVRISFAPDWEYKEACHLLMLTEVAKELIIKDPTYNKFGEEILYYYNPKNINFLEVDDYKPLLEELMVIGSISNLIFLEKSEESIDVLFNRLEEHINYFNKEYRDIECKSDRMLAGMSVLECLSENSRKIISRKSNLFTDAITNILKYSHSELSESQLEDICDISKKLRRSDRQEISDHILNSKLKNDLLEFRQDETTKGPLRRIIEDLN